jgi:hypothetical protein
MKKLSEKEFSTRVVDQTGELELQKSQVYIDEKVTNSYVVGAFLESCIKFDRFYLVFMTDDIPSEDMLHIHLLNEKLSLLDTATIGSAYATGSFKALEICEPNIVKFHFIGLTQWVVHVFQKKQLHFPFISDPKGVSRKISFSSYLKIYGSPIPESV